MVFTMERRETFSSAHRLHSPHLNEEENKRVYGKCNHVNGHGHNYVWRVRLRGELDEKTGMLYDLTQLKKEMGKILELVDHRNIDKDVGYFEMIPSTSENIVKFLYTSLKKIMEKPELLWECQLEETEKNIFTFTDRQSTVDSE